MRRIRLIHWNAAEAAERAARLPADNFKVSHAQLDPASLRDLRSNPPDALVIDLGRLPSHGRDVGVAMRKTRATRGIPLVFVDGDPSKVSRVRQLLPDAVYTDWPNIQSALRQAIASPPSNPVVPESGLAGYSGTPLPRKLGIKAGYAVATPGAPDDFQATLGVLPDDVVLRRRVQGRCDLIVWFVGSRRELRRRIQRYGARAGPGGLWICWPKKASGVQSDLSERVVRETGLSSGLVDYKIAAIDQTWSGLRFTRRKAI
ncbi:MAG: hypothetical protein OXR64_01050 [Chloroflexota bacterium]|nr:hypothetical protein [Chloroflexota bacterium]MDE2918416.1 hypothetical protein [Chloroflexota bacterium]